jgi:hypothetical protein
MIGIVYERGICHLAAGGIDQTDPPLSNNGSVAGGQPMIICGRRRLAASEG